MTAKKTILFHCYDNLLEASLKPPVNTLIIPIGSRLYEKREKEALLLCKGSINL
jgi:hypothetical protein